jgi:hypothetical protein
VVVLAATRVLAEAAAERDSPEGAAQVPQQDPAARAQVQVMVAQPAQPGLAESAALEAKAEQTRALAEGPACSRAEPAGKTRAQEPRGEAEGPRGPAVTKVVREGRTRALGGMRVLEQPEALQALTVESSMVFRGSHAQAASTAEG